MSSSKINPHTIFIQATQNLDAYLKAASRPRGFKDPKLATEFRSELFHLEGWARVHRHWKNDDEGKSFEKIRKETKSLEDVLGRIDLLLAMQKEAKKRKHEALEAVFKDDLASARRGLKHILKNDAWFSDGETRTEKFRKRLSKVDWPTAKHHYQFLAQEIVKAITELQNRFDKEIRPQLAKPVLTHEILDHDLHEFRRELRWFAIYFQTSRGLFAIAPLPKKLSGKEKKLVEQWQGSPFVKLPSIVETKGWLSPLAFYELTRLIEILGVVKNKAETFFFIKEGLLKAGESEATAHETVSRWYGDVTRTTPPKVQKVIAEYDARLPLQQISRDLLEGL